MIKRLKRWGELLCSLKALQVITGFFTFSAKIYGNQRSVFLNGIDIMPNTRFWECVRIDGRTDIYRLPLWGQRGKHLHSYTWNRQEGDRPSHQQGGPALISREAAAPWLVVPRPEKIPRGQLMQAKIGSKQNDGGNNSKPAEGKLEQMEQPDAHTNKSWNWWRSASASTDKIREAYAAGQRRLVKIMPRSFGPRSELEDLDINWVYIGHLQSNKIKKTVRWARNSNSG